MKKIRLLESPALQQDYSAGEMLENNAQIEIRDQTALCTHHKPFEFSYLLILFTQ